MTQAACIICDEHGGVLVGYNDGWEIPGGTVQAGQFPQVAMQEIIKKDFGVDITIERELGQRGQHTWFLGEITAGEPALTTTKYTKFGFFSLVTLTRRYEELAPGTKEFLEAMAYGEIVLDL